VNHDSFTRESVRSRLIVKTGLAPKGPPTGTRECAVADLLELIDAAHSKGLAVILDVVYNHAAIIDNAPPRRTLKAALRASLKNAKSKPLQVAASRSRRSGLTN
jgi:hypothetical protein